MPVRLGGTEKYADLSASPHHVGAYHRVGERWGKTTSEDNRGKGCKKEKNITLGLFKLVLTISGVVEVGMPPRILDIRDRLDIFN